MNQDTDQGAANDLDLFHAAKRGNYDAFEQIVRRHHDRVYRLAFGMTKNQSEAEEVVQDTFLNAWKSIDSFRGDSKPATWIYRIAANTALMRLRSKRRNPTLAFDEVPNGASLSGEVELLGPPTAWSRQPDEKLLTSELGSVIDAAVDLLPEKYRLVLLLRDVEGLSNEDVASTVGLTIPTVKSRLHRSRMFVRERLEDYFRKALT
ncbi:MAG: RNA polymerase sigma factor [Myxococcota bacterium]|nr:sigma-70 family RNA polymerase sigma factor [Myxococcota bacterium]